MTESKRHGKANVGSQKPSNYFRSRNRIKMLRRSIFRSEGFALYLRRVFRHRRAEGLTWSEEFPSEKKGTETLDSSVPREMKGRFLYDNDGEVRLWAFLAKLLRSERVLIERST